jgi:PPOX class probable F420-dependent enzyme
MNLPDEIAVFIDGHRVARLATADRMGVPHVVPICYARRDDVLYFVVDDKPKRRGPRTLKRLANIEQNPRVAVLIDDYSEDWSQLAYLLLQLDATPVQAEAEYATALSSLRERYPPYRAMPLRFATHPMVRMHIIGWHHWRARP